MSVVLVTGSSGIIGVNVIRQLVERGDRVIAFDTRPDQGFLSDIEASFTFVAGDLLDLPWLMETVARHQVTQIVHLAAVMSPHHVTHPYMLSKINLEGTLNVLEAAKLCRVSRVIFGSTRGVIARTEGTPYGHPHYLPVPTTFTGPRIPLTILKLAAEQIGLCYARAGFVDFCALRFADFYGAERIAKPERSQANVFNDIVLNAYFGRETVLPQGADQKFEPLYIKDCAAGVIAACAAKSLDQRLYHIGLGEAVRFGDAISAVKRWFPHARIDVGPGLDFAHLEKDPNYCVLDISTAVEDLGYRPQYDLAAGLADYAEVLGCYVEAGLAKTVIPPPPRRS